LKKAYRNLSLELHPDKNKSPTAPEDFRRVKHAFDILTNSEYREVYNRLGDAGAKVAAQTVVDHKYIIIQMLVYYSSSLIFAFLMTFAEPSGDAMSASFFGLLGKNITAALPYPSTISESPVNRSESISSSHSF
jgi:DnaJ-class molecular chaperone